jgi:hypothetical protein
MGLYLELQSKQHSSCAFSTSMYVSDSEFRICGLRFGGLVALTDRAVSNREGLSMQFQRTFAGGFRVLPILAAAFFAFVGSSSQAASKYENVELSGEFNDGLISPAGDWPLVGIVADTQLQTTQVLARDTSIYRGKFADKVARVALRPRGSIHGNLQACQASRSSANKLGIYTSLRVAQRLGGERK